MAIGPGECGSQVVSTRSGRHLAGIRKGKAYAWTLAKVKAK